MIISRSEVSELNWATLNPTKMGFFENNIFFFLVHPLSTSCACLFVFKQKVLESCREK